MLQKFISGKKCTVQLSTLLSFGTDHGSFNGVLKPPWPQIYSCNKPVKLKSQNLRIIKVGKDAQDHQAQTLPNPHLPPAQGTECHTLDISGVETSTSP